MRPSRLAAALAAILLMAPSARAEETVDFSLFDPAFLKTAGVQTLLDAGRTKEAGQALARHFRQRQAPRYLPGPSARLKPDKAWKSPVADAALRHVFEIRYWTKTRDFGPEVDWLDPALDYEEGAVLHRHHWAGILSEAFQRSGDSRYLKECMKLLRSWRARIPPLPDTQTTYDIPGNISYRGLETGTRAGIWLDALYRFRESPDFTDDDLLFLLSVLHEHGRRLAVLARARPHDPSNHMTVNNRGLFELAVMLPEFQAAGQWRTLALTRTEEQLQEAVLEDGFQLERCPGYHTNCIMDFTLMQRLAALNTVPVSGLFTKRIEAMYECLLKITRPDRTVPLLNDSGADVYRPWMSLGAFLYGRSDFRFLGDDALWGTERIGGVTEEEVQTFRDLKPRAPSLLSLALPASGFYVMRTGWDPGDRYLLLNQGKFGGGHSHADQLSIDLYAYGRPLLVDPGCCAYTDPAMAFLRSPAAHNVVLVDGQGAPLRTEATISLWLTNPKVDAVSGEVAVADGVSWRRTVAFVKPDYWIVLDRVRGGRSAEQLWHYIPGETKADKNQVLITTPAKGGADGNLLIRWPGTEAREVSRPKGFLAAAAAGTAKPDASGKAEAEYLSLRRQGKDALFATLLYPYRGDKVPEATIESLKTDKGDAVRVRHPKEDREEILLIDNAGRDLSLRFLEGGQLKASVSSSPSP